MKTYISISGAFLLIIASFSSCINGRSSDNNCGNIDSVRIKLKDSTVKAIIPNVLTTEKNRISLAYILDTLAAQNLKFTIEEFNNIQQINFTETYEARNYSSAYKIIWSFDEIRSEIFMNVNSRDTLTSISQLKLVFYNDSVLVFSAKDITAFYWRKSSSFFVCRSRTFDRIVTSKNVAAIFRCDRYMFPYFAIKFHHGYTSSLVELCHYERYSYGQISDNNYYAKAKSDTSVSRTSLAKKEGTNLVRLFNEYQNSEMEYEVVFPNGAFFNRTPLWLEPSSVLPFIKTGG
jgi:hypothetical protein